jgi:hypothetical protein
VLRELKRAMRTSARASHYEQVVVTTVWCDQSARARCLVVLFRLAVTFRNGDRCGWEKSPQSGTDKHGRWVGRTVRG